MHTPCQTHMHVRAFSCILPCHINVTLAKWVSLYVFNTSLIILWREDPTQSLTIFWLHNSVPNKKNKPKLITDIFRLETNEALWYYELVTNSSSVWKCQRLICDHFLSNSDLDREKIVNSILFHTVKSIIQCICTYNND